MTKMLHVCYTCNINFKLRMGMFTLNCLSVWLFINLPVPARCDDDNAVYCSFLETNFVYSTFGEGTYSSAKGLLATIEFVSKAISAEARRPLRLRTVTLFA